MFWPCFPIFLTSTPAYPWFWLAIINVPSSFMLLYTNHHYSFTPSNGQSQTQRIFQPASQSLFLPIITPACEEIALILTGVPIASLSPKKAHAVLSSSFPSVFSSPWPFKYFFPPLTEITSHRFPSFFLFFYSGSQGNASLLLFCTLHNQSDTELFLFSAWDITKTVSVASFYYCSNYKFTLAW